jgi:transcriptional regulator with AAA-type ATPase domain/transcriptional regulatory protein LevR
MRQLLKIINQENKKNPLTDEEIAAQLGMGRSDVVKLRRSLGIGNSRQRMRELLEKEIHALLNNYPNLSERALTQKLNENGFGVSRHMVSDLYQQMKIQGAFSAAKQESPNSSEVNDPLVKQTQTAFDALIGAQGSLRTQVELAKAAVFYPHKGLHTLIAGATGVGKSELAYCMHRFALESGTKPSDTPFVVFNCADYAETPQLLLAQLFGYVKGAFTGAEVDKEGLVEKANQGILFLDEIHRLPPEGQEILYYLIDKGKFRRLGESDTFRNVSLMLIAATTENIESFLLLPFRRRIPMVIELPTIAQRPLEERFQIIVSFIREEVSRIKLTMRVSYNAVVALLMYECHGNIGQLRSDIQVACARAFLKNMAQKEKILKIEINDLTHQVVKGLLLLNEQRPIIEKILQGDLEISPTDEQRAPLVEPTYLLPNEVYQEIEDNYIKMENQGIDLAIINRVISDELEAKVRQLIKQAQGNKQNLIRQDLEKIVGEKIVNAVDRMIKLARTRLPDIDDSLLYCLATHLAASYERIRMNNKLIVNPQFQKMQAEYPAEYELAGRMAQIASYYLGTDLPEDEIAFIAMYLKSYAKKDHLHEVHVGVVVLTHGRVAEGMVQVANRLLGVDYAKALEMPLEERSEDALQRAMHIVRQADNGKGVLMLVDMGSLVGFSKLITDSTGIITRMVTRVNTPMVIEAVRKALAPDADIEEIANALHWDNSNDETDVCHISTVHNLPGVIVTICLTGQGAAEWMARMIAEYMPQYLKQVEIITMGALVEEDLQTRLRQIGQNYNLLAVIGTLGTVIPGIPFITVKEIVKGNGLEKLKRIIQLHGSLNKAGSIHSAAGGCLQNGLIRPELVLLNCSPKSKNEALNTLAQILVSQGHVREQYIVSIYEREALAQTLFQDVALPHGSPEYILKPAIAVMTLQEPIEWVDGYRVEIVFMLALNNYQKNEFKKLYSLLNDREQLMKMKQSKNIEQFMRVITDGQMF